MSSTSSILTVSPNKVVELAYTLRNDQGEVLDQADANEAFSYLHGHEQIVPGLEKGLEGARAGDKRKVVVKPVDGYGETDPRLQLQVSRAQFPKDVNLAPGMKFQAGAPDGSFAVFTVQAIEGDQVKVDGNHPLAGQTLHFDVEILGVREATEEEMSDDHDHDHEHGEGCNH